MYYAHLASNRARAHEAHGHSEGPRGGEKFLEKQYEAAAKRVITGEKPGAASSGTGSSTDFEDVPLLPLGIISEPQKVDLGALIKIRTSMWYI